MNHVCYPSSNTSILGEILLTLKVYMCKNDTQNKNVSYPDRQNKASYTCEIYSSYILYK